MSSELKRYVEKALAQGAAKPEIRQTLVTAGWAQRVVDKMLDQYTGVDAHGLAIPAPQLQAHHLARDLFLYCLSLVTLVMSAIALGGLLFEIIDALLPDPAIYGYAVQHSRISWAIAQLVIAFPVYLGLARWIGRDVERAPQKRESLLRKLMIYLILVVTAVTSLGDLVGVLTRLLEGELTLRYCAQSAVVLVISLLIFLYYREEVQRDDRLVQQASEEAKP